MNWSKRTDTWALYSQNPGPGYANCGGSGNVTLDPCNPPMPANYSAVHFRYIWAGQKTFTFFPSPAFMPTYITLNVMAGAATGANNPTPSSSPARTKLKGPGTTALCRTTCLVRRLPGLPPRRRRIFSSSCPTAGLTRTFPATLESQAVNEWNTVSPRPFPSTPGEYWIRWSYSKPDTQGESSSATANGEFETTNYYPDNTNGNWAATGNWSDQTCAAEPPAVPPTVGYGGWFPYAATGYAYPYGASLANTYSDPAQVQELLNAFIQWRYEFWKKDWLVTDPTKTCGPGTYMVVSDNPVGTLSEGNGYGIAISAAIGDKPTFEGIWNFVRHYLSQAADKYCGGLAGWMWSSPANCRPLDSPCDPFKESDCGGNGDSAFDGDVDIGIGLVFAARQWPEYVPAAIDWLIKMECEINTKYDGVWYYGSWGDTADKNCQNLRADETGGPCSYQANENAQVDMGYYPPGYFRVFGDFLQASLDPTLYSSSTRQWHHDFWYKAAQTVYEEYERCYDQTGVNVGLLSDQGTIATPCSGQIGNYDWSRGLWRLGIDAAWFGNRHRSARERARLVQALPERSPRCRRKSTTSRTSTTSSASTIRRCPTPTCSRPSART